MGDGTTTNRVDPTTVVGIAGATQVAVGYAHTCALVSGVVKCWGVNTNGELGDGTFANNVSPVTVTGINTATEIKAGWSHTCAVLADTSVKCWGRNTNGELGDLSTTNRGSPVAPDGGLSSVLHVAPGAFHTCAVLTDGTGRCWGMNTFGQVGDNTSGVTRLQPTVVVGLTGATAIAAWASPRRADGDYDACLNRCSHSRGAMSLRVE